jgi:tight adherence protein B
MSDPLLLLAVAALAATGVVAFCLGVGTTFRRRSLDQRLHDHVGLELRPARAAYQPEDPRPGAREKLAGEMNRRLSRSALGAAVQARLVRAGLDWKPSQLILIQSAAGLAAGLTGFLALRSAGALPQLLAGLALGALGFAVPMLVLGFLEQKRLAAFERQLPQAIDAMANTLQAGSALPQAMEMIAREMPAPIGAEFRRVLREMELGLSLTDGLAGLHGRVRSTDLLLVNSAIAIQQRVGGDLAGMLRGISHTVRERLRIRGEVKVLTAQGRYSAYIITALPIVMFLYLWFTNRPYISQLFLPGITQALLAGGIAGIVVGYYAMKRIVAIEV